MGRVSVKGDKKETRYTTCFSGIYGALGPVLSTQLHSRDLLGTS